MIALEDLYRKIDEETAACVERKRNQPFFRFAWIRSRQSFEPQCRGEVTARYQDQITAAQQNRYDQEATAYEAINNPLPIDPQIVQIITIALIIVLAIAWVLA